MLKKIFLLVLFMLLLPIISNAQNDSSQSRELRKIKIQYFRPDGSQYIKYEGDRFYTEIVPGNDPNPLMLGIPVPKQHVYLDEGTIVVEQFNAIALFKNLKDASANVDMSILNDPELISFRVFPNPSSQKMCISFNLLTEKPVKIELFTYKEKTSNLIADGIFSPGDHIIEIPDDFYNNEGMYIISFAAGDKKITNSVYLKK